SATIMHAGYRDGVQRFEAEITGTEAQMRVGGRQLWISRAGAWEEVTPPAPAIACRPGCDPPSAAFGLEVTDFARAILDGRERAGTGGYGAEVVGVLVAAEESSASGREVRLDG